MNQDNDCADDENMVADGGDPACWAHLLCPVCGNLETEGHQATCPYGECPKTES